jgi:CspA family cold shock protein
MKREEGRTRQAADTPYRPEVLGRSTGTVKWWDGARAFGFISCHSGRDYFFHVTGLVGTTAPPVGALVSFDITEGRRGPQASNVRLAAS